MRAILLSGGSAWVFVKAVTILFGLIAVSRLLPGPNRQVPGYRPRPLRAAVRYGGALSAAAAVITGCAMITAGRPGHAPAPPRSDALALGMYAPGVATSYTPEQEFTAATGVHPSVVLAYSALRAPFNTGFARLALAHGATPFIQLMPGSVPMRAVASGAEDTRLRADAAQVKNLGHQVMLSFAPEANGTWYGWGWSHTPPAEWVAAWRHVVTVFRQAGAVNVTWVWTVNVTFPHSGPVADYWPGAAYVGEVGIDGYLVRPSDTFTSLFGSVLSAVRKLTTRPVILSETAVGPAAGTAAIGRLFAGARANKIGLLVWFDEAQHDGLYHQDWRLEDDPAALAAYRAAAKEHS
jgi:glycosyl hydrolase family 26